jgi:hypothetical protein
LKDSSAQWHEDDHKFRVASVLAILEIVFLNYRLNDATLVPTIRKPFDMLAEGVVLENHRDDRTKVELLVRGSDGMTRFLAAFSNGVVEMNRPNLDCTTAQSHVGLQCGAVEL